MSKLAIAPEKEEDRYETTIRVVCYACRHDSIDNSIGRLPEVIHGVMHALTFSKREEVKAWEQEFVPCEHTLCLNQQESRQIPSQGILLARERISVKLTLCYRSRPMLHV